MTGFPLWTPRRGVVALAAAVLTALVIGVPTVVIPNPVFGRAVPVTWWSYPVLAVVAVLSGLLIATYVKDPTDRRDDPVVSRKEPGADGDALEGQDPVARRGVVAGALSFFAVGCPVCNKVVLLALGSSGALTWFAPLQPLLALLSIAGLGWALRVRLTSRRACPVP